VALLAAVGIAAVAGLVYELLAGAVATFLLGGSVTQFSLVIGLFLSGMGLGSYLSQFIRRHVVAAFVFVELAVGLVGGFMGLVAFAAFAWTQVSRPILFGELLAVGVLVGLEIPLVIRILRRRAELRVSVANVLAVDYAGALAASVLFPFVLVPYVGLVRAGLLAGIANVGVGWVALWLLRRRVGSWWRLLVGFAAAATVALGAALGLAGSVTGAIQQALFQDPIVYTETTPYQHLTITRWRDDLRLFIDGALQFSSSDEYRYHEPLVLPAMAAVPNARRVLILGGGDGLAAQRVLAHPGVQRVDLVDLDPAMTRLFSHAPPLVRLNGGALTDPRLHVHNEDAMAFLARGGDAYDVILADLPDPNSISLSRLYTQSFYRLVFKRLARGGVFVTQATSPFETREAFWCIAHTVASVRDPEADPGADRFVRTYPYTVNVPTFGQWGFVLASSRPLDPAHLAPRIATRFLTAETVADMFRFPKDLAEVSAPVNRMDDHALVRLYELGWERYH